MTTNLTLADAPDFGRDFTMVANKSAGLVHVVSHWGSKDPYAACHALRKDIGRTVVGETSGYRGVAAFKAPEGLSMCRECVQNCKVIQRDQAGHWLKIQRDGAAAGRTIVHTVTIRIVEHVPNDATLYSLKSAKKSLRHGLNLDPKSYDYIGKRFSKADRYEFSADITSTFQEA